MMDRLRIKCPNCGSDSCHEEYDTKSQESSMLCYLCGYSRIIIWSVDSQGEFKTKDGTTNYGYENRVAKVQETKHPYGCVTVELYSGNMSYYSMDSKEEFEMFEYMLAPDELDNIALVTLSKYTEDKIIVVTTIYRHGVKVA